MTISRRVKRNAPMILALSKASEQIRVASLRTVTRDFVLALVEIAHNVLIGSVSISKSQLTSLRKYKNDIKALVSKQTSIAKKRVIVQKGGFIGLLLKPVLGLLGSLIPGLLGVQRK